MIAKFLESVKALPKVLLLSLCIAAGGVEAANIAGQVALVEGEVKIVDANGSERIPQVGDKVFEGDVLQSGISGELHVHMLDDAFIALRANTQLKIEIYQAQGVASDSAVLSLLKGSFRSITGWIGKLNRKNYKVQTLNANLGIRGTDHEPLFVPETDALEIEANPPGTYDKVNSGGTVIESAFGVIEVAPDQVGYAPLRGAPRLLPRTPTFYQRAKHERKIDEKKNQLQRNADERVQDLRKDSPGGDDDPEGAKPVRKPEQRPERLPEKLPERLPEKLKDSINTDPPSPQEMRHRRERRPQRPPK